MTLLTCQSASGTSVVSPPTVEVPTHPTEITIRNQSKREIDFGDRPNPVAGLYLVRENGSWGSLTLDGPPGACDCPCGQKTCASCAPRMVRPIPILPGGEHQVHWNGRVRVHHHRSSWRCYEVQSPPPGKYVMLACGSTCEAFPIQLPAAKPIRIELTGRRQRPSGCPLAPMLSQRLARVAIHMMTEELGAFDRPAPAALTECDPTQVRCVAPKKLETLNAQGGCTLAVARQPSGYELRAWVAPQPNAPPVAHSTFLDPNGVTVGRVHYQY